MEIEIFTKSQDSSATEFSNVLVVKSHLKLVDQIVRLIFSHGNSGFSIKILTDVCFAYKEKEIQRRCSLSFKLDRIGFLFFYSLKDVIASVNSLYEVRIIDVAVLYENTHLKHFVFGDPTEPAKVSRVHCRSRPGLPVLVS